MDDKKTYSVVGTVTIGTDEYRDLIENLAEARHDVEKRRSEWWDQHNKCSKLENELKEALVKLEELEAFVKSDEAISAKLKLFRIERQM